MTTCPVCDYKPGEPFVDHDICPCCGTQFGYHDAALSHTNLFVRWWNAGAKWHSKRVKPPEGWKDGATC